MLVFTRIYPERTDGYLSLQFNEASHRLMVDSLTSGEITKVLKEVADKLDIELLESGLSIVELWEWLPKLHDKNVPIETVQAVTRAFEPVFAALQFDMTNLVTDVTASGQFVLYMHKEGRKPRLVWEDDIRWSQVYVPGAATLQAVPPRTALS